MRIEISRYLSKLEQSQAIKAGFENEIKELSSLNVDGIITTNWDVLIEQLFPDYDVYIGQEDLLFSNPQQIAEIYKIHGCATQPQSLILTDGDYAKFNERNAYLAAKLITIFVEHPVVFIGYSITDDNIQALLRSISLCIGPGNIEKLRRNLIFVQPLGEGDSASIADTYLTIDGAQIPLLLVKTDDFLSLYEAINTTKRKIPARILRYCKEQLFELVRSSEPEKKLCVVDYDEIDRKDDVEFLVGVGVASSVAGIGATGYAAIETSDLIHDVIFDGNEYDPEQIIKHVVPRAGRNSQNVPVHKYLSAIGIDTEQKYKASKLPLDKWVTRAHKDYRLTQYTKPYFRNYRHLALKDLIAACTPENAAAYIPHMSKEDIDLEELRTFLILHEAKLSYRVSSYASNFRKLASLYDKLRYGW